VHLNQCAAPPTEEELREDEVAEPAWLAEERAWIEAELPKRLSRNAWMPLLTPDILRPPQGDISARTVQAPLPPHFPGNEPARMKPPLGRRIWRGRSG